MIHTTGQS